MVAAAYEAGEALLGERVQPLLSHNAADKQTGSVGDVEVTLVGDDEVILESYQRLLLEQADSAVGQPLKETWLALRQAAETRPEQVGGN